MLSAAALQLLAGILKEEPSKQRSRSKRCKRPKWKRARIYDIGTIIYSDDSKQDEKVGAAFLTLTNGGKLHESISHLENNTSIFHGEVGLF